jgi:hypothetical protein
MGRGEENEKRLRDKEKGRNREETGRRSYVRHQEGTGRKLDREKRVRESKGEGKREETRRQGETEVQSRKSNIEKERRTYGIEKQRSIEESRSEGRSAASGNQHEEESKDQRLQGQ